MEIRCTKSMGRRRRCRKLCATLRIEDVRGIEIVVVAATENGFTEWHPWPDEYESDGTIIVVCRDHGPFLTLPQSVRELEALMEDPSRLRWVTVTGPSDIPAVGGPSGPAIDPPDPAPLAPPPSEIPNVETLDEPY